VSEILQSRVAVVTGGTDGIGKAIARGLAERGVQVIVVGRDPDKGARATRELQLASGNSHVGYVQADLALMNDARRLGAELLWRCRALHLLVHSAGMLNGRRELTAEGIERNFAANYLGRFALTQSLLPALEAGGRPGRAARIVLVSGAAQHGRVRLDDVNLTKNFSTVGAVRQFCQANDLFTVELARRLRGADGPPRVTVSCLKMGVVKTNIRRTFPMWMKLLVPLLFDPLLGQTPEEAAAAALLLLLADDLEGVTGALFLKIRALKQIATDDGRLTALGLGEEDRRRLWELSERLTAEHHAADEARLQRSAAAPSQL
jgi:NAD(P)-dependent dehydrogenase (short-subunit alcohol dehydrogenase family)